MIEENLEKCFNNQAIMKWAREPFMG